MTENVGDVMGRMILNEIKKEYRKQNHIATGEALKSWRIKKDRVESTSPGAYFLEHGRPPNRKPPPINEIIKWCNAKGIPADKAWAIRHKIGRDGIQATYIIQDIAKKYGLRYEHKR